MFSKILTSDTINILYENDEFCTKLGKVILTSSKLEKELLILLQNEQNTQKPPLSMLIQYINKKYFFPDIVSVLSQMSEENLNLLLHRMIEKNIAYE